MVPPSLSEPGGSPLRSNSSTRRWGRRAGPVLSLVAVVLATAVWGWLTLGQAPRRVYVVCMLSNEVAILDPGTHEVVGRLATDKFPQEVTLGNGGWRLYVSNQTSGTVQVFDTVTQRLLKRYVVGGSPGGLQVDERSGLLNVAHINGGPDSVVTLETPAAAPDGAPVTVASPQVKRVDRKGAPRFNSDSVEEDQEEVVSQGRPRGADYFLSLNVRFPYLLVTDVKTMRVRSRIPVGGEPSDLVMGPDRLHAFVAVRRNDAVAVVDAEQLRVQQTLAVGKGPARLMAMANGRDLYVMNTDDSTVSLVRMDRNEVVKTIPVGQAPLGAVSWPLPRNVR